MDPTSPQRPEDLVTRKSLIRLSIITALALAASGSPWAQTTALAPGQVSGAELQAWIDADGFVVGGLNLANGCHFIARGRDTARIQVISCPTMAQAFTVAGELRIAGNQMCSKFTYPDGSRLDACQDLFKVGDNKYEVRVDGAVRSVLYRLLR
jgi:hypothetical protein